MIALHPVRALIALLLAAFAALPLVSATAAPPTFHDQFRETIPGVDICGVIGTADVNVNQVGQISGASFKVTGQTTVVFTADDGQRRPSRLAAR